jgi:hypothetical protein
MKITDVGQVQVSVQELLAFRLRHFCSVVDLELSDKLPSQLCGSVTTLCGYTEWVGDSDQPISIGWDWSIRAHAHTIYWFRDDLPRTNIQVLNQQGHPLDWYDNLSVLATWVDAQDWGMHVAQRVGCSDTNMTKD